MFDFMYYEKKKPCFVYDVEITVRLKTKYGFHLPPPKPLKDEMTERTSAEGDRGAVNGFTGLLI